MLTHFIWVLRLNTCGTFVFRSKSMEREQQLVAETPELIKCLRTWMNAVKGTQVQVISRFPSRSWAVCWDQERRCSQCGCALEAGSALQMKSWIHQHGCAEGLEGLPWNWREECLLREKLSDWEKGEGERLTSHCRSFFFLILCHKYDLPFN